MQRLNRIKSLEGKKFGRLTATKRIEFTTPGVKTQVKYECHCSCGRVIQVLRGNLTHGNTRSCGCLKKEIAQKRKTTDSLLRLHEIGRYYRRNASVRNIEWGLSFSELQKIVSNNCVYCGENPHPFIGIDRIENSKGYIHGNIVPCCKRCNQAKNDMTVDQFRTWISKVYMTIGEPNWQISL